MVKVASLLLGFLPTLVPAVPVVVESLDEVPAGWNKVKSAEPERLVKFAIGLQPEDEGRLEQTLRAVSDPSHPRYGQHLSREEAKALLSPRTEATDLVKRWLVEAGVADHQVHHDGQWVHVHTTITRAERLLATRFAVFARDGEQVVRTLEYSVPAEIGRHIDTIQPTTLFASVDGGHASEKPLLSGLAKRTKDGSGKSKNKVDLDECKTALTPACIRKLYRMPKTEVKAHPKSLMTVPGFRGQAAQHDQLKTFLEEFDHNLIGVNFSTALINGGLNPQGSNVSSGEANLDIQYSVPLVHGIPVRYDAVGGEEHDLIPDLDIPDASEDYMEPYLEYASYLLDLPNKSLPQVVSISYGVNEQHVPKVYAQKVCNMFSQLGTRGVSILVAAGNNGVGWSCQSNDGKNTTKFLPAFPAACPYVTTVGGTESNSPEVAIDYSTGGFSEYWSRPWWQEKAIKEWLKRDGDEWKQYYNAKGRGFPDVAVLASGYQVYNHGEVETTGGTSAATPVFASVIALINNERLKKGRPPMGFLNPWLYQVGKHGLADITKGRSIGCEGRSVAGLPSPLIPNAGFNAVKGWDPVTGLGTPLYDCLLKLAK